MKKKIVFGFLISIIIVTIIFVIVYKDSKEKESMSTKAVMIGNMIASYEYIDRNIDLTYFYDLDANTTYEKMVNEIGKPNGAMGSGIITPYYRVGEQYVVIWFASDEDGTYTNILKMRLYTS
ncbi:MAG: hypothetical protein K2I21_10990, partial [Acetatifactor sp.]|nr:hypothetical protein [Acetatifactor sp.]